MFWDVQDRDPPICRRSYSYTNHDGHHFWFRGQQTVEDVAIARAKPFKIAKMTWIWNDQFFVILYSHVREE